MKKIALLFLIGASTLLFSCRKIQENPRYVPTQEESTLVKTGVVTLELSMQNASTKASITNSGEARWQLYDSLAVFCTDGTKLCFYIDSEVAESRKAFFKGVVPDGKELGTLIIYPYTAAKNVDVANDKITLDLPNDISSECGVMYGLIENSNKIELQQLMGYAVFSIKNINSATRKIVVKSSSILSGEMNLKLSELLENGVPSVTALDNPGISIIYASTPESTQQICIPVPVGIIQQYNISTYNKSGKFLVSKDILEAAAYTQKAKVVNYVDSLPDYIDKKPVKEGYACVCNLYWALGNLTYNSTIPDENGFQSGWHLASAQWMYRYYDQGEKFNKNSVDYNGQTGRADVATDNTYYDHFTFGGIAEQFTYTADGGFLKGNVAVDIAGKMFSDADASVVTTSFTNAKTGDVAYWATKGRLRMPSQAELGLLTTGADAQYGHVAIKDASGNPVKVLGYDLYVWGMYFTDMEGAAPVVKDNDIEITQEMLTNGRGLFLPLAGRKANSSDVQVINTRKQAIYWAGQGSDDPCSTKYTYGYAWALSLGNGSVSFKGNLGDAYTRNSGWCIRPILVE